jgi:disulfide bond formation protein DsbB
MVMTRAKTIWFAVVVVVFVAGIIVAAVTPFQIAAVALLLGAIVALAGLLFALQRSARHTEGWNEPGPFYAGSGSGPRGPQAPR